MSNLSSPHDFYYLWVDFTCNSETRFCLGIYLDTNHFALSAARPIAIAIKYFHFWMNSARIEFSTYNFRLGLIKLNHCKTICIPYTGCQTNMGNGKTFYTIILAQEHLFVNKKYYRCKYYHFFQRYLTLLRLYIIICMRGMSTFLTIYRLLCLTDLLRTILCGGRSELARAFEERPLKNM